jgi:hypothetical protein
MALVSFSDPVRRDIPHEPGQWMDLRKPSNKACRQARKIVSSEFRERIQQLGADLFRVIRDGEVAAASEAPVVKPEDADRYAPEQFDRDTLLASAIKAWSYAAPVTAETIADLDETTARWAHETVVELMQPPSAEATKNA